MHFGRRLLEQELLAWRGRYIPYHDLKQILSRITQDFTRESVSAEGDFLSAILIAILNVDEFFVEQEANYIQRLAEVSQALASPMSWLTVKTGEFAVKEDITLPQLAAMLEEGVHMRSEKKQALDSFIALCADIDELRKYSVINSLAIRKIVKKHDKCSPIKLLPNVLDFVKTRAFTMSRRLATTFTHAQCIANEIIAAGTHMKPELDDYTCASPPFRLTSITLMRENTRQATIAVQHLFTPFVAPGDCSPCRCSICLEVLKMPVVLSCAHRFCYSCLSEVAWHSCTKGTDGACPLCKKETNLDPNHYDIHPVLNRFVRSHFSDDTSSSPKRRLQGGTEIEGMSDPPKNSESSSSSSFGCDKYSNSNPSSSIDELEKSDVSTLASARASRIPSASDVTMPMQSRGDKGLAHDKEHELSKSPPSVDTLGDRAPSAMLPASSVEQSLASDGKALVISKLSRKRACFECHRAKAACEGQPCRRCSRLGKECVVHERAKRRRRNDDWAIEPPIPPTCAELGAPSATAPTSSLAAKAAPSARPPSSAENPSTVIPSIVPAVPVHLPMADITPLSPISPYWQTTPAGSQQMMMSGCSAQVGLHGGGVHQTAPDGVQPMMPDATQLPGAQHSLPPGWSGMEQMPVQQLSSVQSTLMQIEPMKPEPARRGRGDYFSGLHAIPQHNTQAQPSGCQLGVASHPGRQLAVPQSTAAHGLSDSGADFLDLSGDDLQSLLRDL